VGSLVPRHGWLSRLVYGLPELLRVLVLIGTGYTVLTPCGPLVLSRPGSTLQRRGGLMAEEAVELLKAFYAQGNPKRTSASPLFHGALKTTEYLFHLVSCSLSRVPALCSRVHCSAAFPYQAVASARCRRASICPLATRHTRSAGGRRGGSEGALTRGKSTHAAPCAA